jgi:hypothetical protein
MAITEESRHHLYKRFEALWGPEEAAMMLEHLPPVGWGEVARRSDITDLDVALRSEITGVEVALRSEMADLGVALRSEMDHQGAMLRVEMAAQAATLRGEMAELRGEVRVEMADLRTELHLLFSGFQEQFRAEQRATNRQVILALAIGLVSMVLAIVGLS